MQVGLIIIAVLLLLIGIVSMVTPIPGGIFLIVFGFGLLIYASPRAEKYIRIQRTQKKWINSAMTWVEDKMGANLSGTMRRTRPCFQINTPTQHNGA